MIRYEMKLYGKIWHIRCSNGLSYSVPNHKGMYYLTELLIHTDCRIPFTCLVPHGVVKEVEEEFTGDCHFRLAKYGLYDSNQYTGIPKSDKKTIKAIALEIVRLKEELSIMESYHDYGQIEIIHTELMKLDEYLSGVYSQRKAIKLFNSAEANLYTRVKKSLQRIYHYIQKYDLDLAALLKSVIHIHAEYVQMDSFQEIQFEIRGRS